MASSGSLPAGEAAALSANVKAFCEAFVTGTMSGGQMLDLYFTSEPSITEHGPSWATARLPFVGKTFRGRLPSSDTTESNTSCDEYFNLLAKTLSLHAHEGTLPPVEGYAVDSVTRYRSEKEGSGVVLVKANARLESVGTGKSWEEDFVFVFSEFGEKGKIGRMEIWADNLSAWTAVGE